jgi:hypothetical protein
VAKVGQTKEGTQFLAITQAGKVVIDWVVDTASFASEMQRRSRFSLGDPSLDW